MFSYRLTFLFSQFSFRFQTELFHQPCRWAKSSERTLEAIKADEQSEPCPVWVMKDSE